MSKYIIVIKDKSQTEELIATLRSKTNVAEFKADSIIYCELETYAGTDIKYLNVIKVEEI